MEKTVRIKNKSKAAFDKQAGNYDSTYYGQHARSLYHCIIEKLDTYTYQNILDIGCGTGNILSEILKRKHVKAAGLDLSEKMLGIARERLGEGADLRIGDSEQLPWQDGCFDMIICTDSFHHYPKPEAVLKEIRRVLGPKGKLIIADPWFPTPIRQITNLFMPFNKDGDVKMYSKNEMKKMFCNCQLNFISWEQAGMNAFITVAEK